MNNYSFIAFDMDGTLLDSRKQILPSSLEAIQLAAEHGKTIALATGRSLPELTAPLQQLPSVRYVIAVSGALVFDVRQKQALFSQILPEELVLELFSRAKKLDVMIHIHSLRSYVQKSEACHMKDYSMGIYQEMFDRVATAVDDLEKTYRDEHFPAYKFNFYCKSQKQRDEIRTLIADLPLTAVDGEEASLELSPLGISKGEGLRQLCRILSVPLEQTIAVGDSNNDLDLLKTAGLSIAMGNACKTVKETADATVANNDQGGCAEAIERFLL